MNFGTKSLCLHFATAFLACGLAASSAFADAASDEKAIMMLLTKAYPESVNSSNAPGYATLFTADGARIPPRRKTESSRKLIETSIERVFSKVSIDAALAVNEIEVMGDLAWAIGIASGTRSLKASSEGKGFETRILFVLKKQSGDWRIHRQMWNASPSSKP